MAGLPAFSGSTFRHFMTRPVALDAGQKHDPSQSPSLQPLRSRQTGIREHTDESSDLPTSNDILQHLSESYRGGVPHHASEFETLDQLDNEVNQLREDLSKLREEADHGRAASSAEREHTQQGTSASPSRSHDPVSEETQPLSLAARLQRQHEEADRQREQARNRPPAPTQLPPPPSPQDFPVLGSPTDSSQYSSSNANTPTGQSYAAAVVRGLQKTIKATPTTPRSSLESQQTAEEDSSVIVKTEISDKAKTSKGAPHFAQPTQSYTRRSGETLRKEAAASQPKAMAEASSSRPVKGKEPAQSDTATDKLTQRQQKRKSLPGDWMKADAEHEATRKGEQIPSTMSAATVKQDITQRVSPTRIPVPASGSSVKSEASTIKPTSRVAQAQQSPRLQKKTSSYMSPTSATTQRTAATLGKDKGKRDSPSPKKRPPKLQVSPPKQMQPRSPELLAAGSDTSSVQFILDRPAALVTSPSSRLSSPVAQYLEEQQAGRASPIFGSPLNTAPLQPGSPSKMGRKSRMKEHFSSPMGSTDQPPSSPDLTTLDSMPRVGNTTTVRRTSNREILRPILQRLSAEGLARDTALIAESPSPPTVSISDALGAARDGSPRNAGTFARPDLHTDARPTGPLVSRLRAQQGSSRASSYAEVLAGRRSVSLASDALSQNTATQFSMPSSFPAAQDTPTPAPGRHMPYSSLRVTADEFTPMLQKAIPAPVPHTLDYGSYQAPALPPPLPQAQPSYGLNSLTAFRTPEEWLNTPVETKMLISQLRSLRNPKPWHQQSINPFNQPQTMRTPRFSFPSNIDENGSPQAGHSGAEMKLQVHAGKKSVHWSVADSDNTSTPLSFGRAPAPPAQPSPHATISPTSDDTSPLKTPRTVAARPWSIGSASAVLPYGWTGGDGKEIRFVGYGPHAERDPNKAVNFDFLGQRSTSLSRASTSRLPFGGYGEKENLPGELDTVAPRSQKQWAEKLGFDRNPCGRMEIVSASEVGQVMPFANEVVGYCRDCAGEH